MIDPACRPTLWAMTTIYRELLERIAKDPHRIVEDRRVRLNAIHKTSIALRAKWMARSAGPAK
jgi:phytoene/squalene synthetase